jgi:histidyl-tRNA synthetase
MAEKLSTEPYKGVRDFYPNDMAVQSHIFDTWSRTAESFGYERYDASVLEPSELYKSKGAENEEMVNEQTYTFVDRGEREVTLRPEMTPTVARLVAGKYKELSFPVRWYSMPNLFRYERTQRGRVREHWQLNCDIFGSDDIAADVEIIALAYQTLINFGARPEMFTIKVNDRHEMKDFYHSLGVIDEDSITKVTRLNDRFHKIDRAQYMEELRQIVPGAAEAILTFLEESRQTENEITRALNKLGITNVEIDRSLARGFDYYTGTIFEIFDNDAANNRSMLGGGRYDNLTSLFGVEGIGGVGFGMGDVTMRDFLVTHELLPQTRPGAQVVVIPTEETWNIEAEKAALRLRSAGLSVMVDISSKKLGKKMAAADHSGTGYVLVVGEDEVARGEYVLKNLADGTEQSGTLDELSRHFSS